MIAPFGSISYLTVLQVSRPTSPEISACFCLSNLSDSIRGSFYWIISVSKITNIVSTELLSPPVFREILDNPLHNLDSNISPSTLRCNTSYSSVSWSAFSQLFPGGPDFSFSLFQWEDIIPPVCQQRPLAYFCHLSRRSFRVQQRPLKGLSMC